MRSPAAVSAVHRGWSTTPLPGRVPSQNALVPPLRVSDVVTGMTLLEHFLRPLGSPIPVADVCHTVSNGLASLIALNAKWTHGVPFLLTEHGLYLRERYLEFRTSAYSFAVRAFVLRFFRLLTCAAYLEADYITPGSEYNRRWQVRHGAQPERVRPVYNGVDPTGFPLGAEPERPTLTWVGRIAPIKDVESLITAFSLVRKKIPQACLRLFGSAPPGSEEYLARCVRLVDKLGLTNQVTFEGRVEAIVEAYHAGNVVVLSSASEGFPYTVLEAMASGRATVSTDVGGVREAVGDTGLVVPPRDPVAFAAACVRLLSDGELRGRMADAARTRALSHFTLNQFLQIYRDLYPALVSADFPPGNAPETRKTRADMIEQSAPLTSRQRGPDRDANDRAPTVSQPSLARLRKAEVSLS
jgi:polysaccharide biosynthesis protein PelF